MIYNMLYFMTNEPSSTIHSFKTVVFRPPYFELTLLVVFQMRQ
jgi:hypothetical protein